LDISGALCVDRQQLDSTGALRRLNLLEHLPVRRISGIDQQRHSRDFGRDCQHHLDVLGSEIHAEIGETGRVASRPRKARDDACSYRISGYDEDDGDRSRRLLGGQCAGGSQCQNDIDFDFHQLCREFGKSLVLAVCEPPFDEQIPAFDIAELVQPTWKGPVVVGIQGRWAASRRKHTNAPRFAGLLG
jgi:hypothetical protein